MGVKIAVFFGSRARRTQRDDSDFDVAVLSSKPLNLGEIEKICEVISRVLSTNPWKIDIVEISKAQTSSYTRSLETVK